MRGVKGMALVLMVFLVGFGAVCWGETGGAEGKERILHFPKERSLGRIMVIDANIKRQIQTFHFTVDGVDWHHRQAEYIGEAQGDVVIPAGKKTVLILNKNAIKDLSPLLNLKPDDLYMFSNMVTADNYPSVGRCMQYIAHLTGLKDLRLGSTKIAGEGMKHITKLQSLETLILPKGLTNRGLSYVAQLKSLKGLYFVENRVTNAGLERYLPRLTKLEELVLSGEQINDAGLAHLANLKSLKYLFLWGENFSDAGMAHLKNVPSLKILNIMNLPITDAGVRNLSGHGGLENISLYNTEVTNRGLAYLKSIPSLRKLDLGKRHFDLENPPITDAGMVHLAQIKSLEFLVLPPVGITDKGLGTISNLKNLKYLKVCSCSSSPLTDKALQHVSKLRALEFLSIAGTGFTDAGMDEIAKLTNLRELNLPFDNTITNKGLAKLKTLKSLERLYLDSKNITISGLSYLNALKNLSYLLAHGIKQDNSGLDISGLTKLEELWLTPKRSRKNGVSVHDALRDEDLVCLKKLKNLRFLSIGGQKSAMITDAGIAHLRNLTNFTHLAIGSPYLTDDALSYLSDMKKLNDLQMRGNFTGKGLCHLEELKALRYLKISSTNKFSPSALRLLRKKLPNILTFEVQKKEP